MKTNQSIDWENLGFNAHETNSMYIAKFDSHGKCIDKGLEPVLQADGSWHCPDFDCSQFPQQQADCNAGGAGPPCTRAKGAPECRFWRRLARRGLWWQAPVQARAGATAGARGGRGSGGAGVAPCLLATALIVASPKALPSRSARTLSKKASNFFRFSVSALSLSVIFSAIFCPGTRLSSKPYFSFNFSRNDNYNFKIRIVKINWVNF